VPLCSGKLIFAPAWFALNQAVGADDYVRHQEVNKMMSRNKQFYAARARIDDFGPMPTVRQQALTLALAGAAMIFISGTMSYFGLI
jgi:hypothetical protein